MSTIKVVATTEAQKLTVGTEGSAGYDLRINIDVVIPVGKVQLVGTGISVQIPKDSLG